MREGPCARGPTADMQDARGEGLNANLLGVIFGHCLGNHKLSDNEQGLGRGGTGQGLAV